MALINSPAELEEFRQGILSKRDSNKPCITLCSGSACHATGSREVAAAIEEELEKQGLGDQVDVRGPAAMGSAKGAPLSLFILRKSVIFKSSPKTSRK